MTSFLASLLFVAALSFILFGLWTVRGDTLEGEDEARPAGVSGRSCGPAQAASAVAAATASG